MPILYDLSGVIRTEKWRGDPEAEHMFAELESDLNAAKLEHRKEHNQENSCRHWCVRDYRLFRVFPTTSHSE